MPRNPSELARMEGEDKEMNKENHFSKRVLELANKVLDGYEPTKAEIRVLAGVCVFMEDTPPWEHKKISWRELQEMDDDGAPSGSLDSDYTEGESMFGEKN